MSSTYTALYDTFTGTVGTSIVGHAPDVQNLTDVWEQWATGPILDFAAGGGAVTTASGTSWAITTPLTGLAGAHTVTLVLSFTGTTSVPVFYLRADTDTSAFGTNLLGLSLNLPANGADLLILPGGTDPATSYAWAANTTYTLTIALTASTATVTVDGGSGSTTLFSAVSIPTYAGTGTRLYLRQLGGTPQELKVHSCRVTQAGPASVTVTGPAALVVGVASTNYTATLDSAVPSCGAGIPLDPTTTGFAATPGVSTATIAPGASAATFTETSSAAGSGSVSVTPHPANVSGLTVVPRSGVTSASTGATSFSLTAPSPPSSFQGVASGNFSVQPNGTTTGTFTPTPVSGVTFTPATLTWSAESSAKTFTISKAAAGAVSISGSFTNSLTPPSPATYTFLPISLTVTPTGASAVDGSSTVPVVATLAGSSASLTATVGATGGGAAAGSISTASPASGVVFHYTPPASGTGSDTVTVTDSTDGLTATCVVSYAPGGQVNYESVLSGIFPTGLAGTATYQVTVNGSLVGSPATAGVSELPSGSRSYRVTKSCPSGSTITFLWADGSGGPTFVDASPQPVLQSGGPGGFPAQAPDGWVTQAAVAPLLADGTMRAASAVVSGVARLSLDASDAKANALAAGAVNEYLAISGGTGRGQSIPVASVSGGSGSKVALAQAGYALLTPLATDSVYYWTGIPASIASSGQADGGSFDSGTVSATPQPPTSSTFYANADGLSTRTDAYKGMALRFTAGANANLRRGVVSYTFAGGLGYFVLASPFPFVPAGDDPFDVE